MAVGRFRDGTPLVLSETDGLIPAKANNFRYDGLDANLQNHSPALDDSAGLKCPFQAHIRKTSPRQSDADEAGDRSRRITRRGIPYGERRKAPNVFQALDDLPTGNVGLLFACFQSSIVKQYAFMQKTWANNTSFKKGETGLDPIVGQALTFAPEGNPEQQWRSEYGGAATLPFPQEHVVTENFSDFVKFRGGEFFFAPSMPFLLNEPGPAA
jgi:deferrochelatase/peroxidase EfeB